MVWLRSAMPPLSFVNGGEEMLRHVDGMALYADVTTMAAAGKFDGLYSTPSVSYRQAGAFAGSYSVSMPSGTIGAFQLILANRSWYSAGMPYIVGCRIKPNTNTNTRSYMGICSRNDITAGITIVTNGTNWQLFDNNNNITRATGPALTTGVWDYHELKIDSSGGPNTIRVVWRVNGVQQYDSGATLSLFGTGLANFIQLGGIGSTNTNGANYSDFYVADTTGTYNNDFLGDIRVETLAPIADGANTGFSALSNLVPTGVFTAASTANFVAGANTTPSVVTNDYKTGMNSVYIARTVAGAGPPSLTTLQGTSGIAVTAGSTYSAVAKYRAGSTTNLTAQVGISWYNSSGTFISTSLGTAVLVPLTSWYAGQVSCTDVAPAGAAFAAVYLAVNNNADMAAAGIGFFAGNEFAIIAPGTATHTASVSEVPHDGDDSYVWSTTAGMKDTYTMSDLASTTGQVVGVNALAMARKEVPTPRALAAIIRPTSGAVSAGSKYTVMSNSTSGDRLRDVGTAMTQLSDGTLVYLAYDPVANNFALYYTVDRVNVNLITTFPIGNTSATQFFGQGGYATVTLATDSSDNIYVVGGNGNFQNLGIYALTKGAGYSWTSSAPASITGTATGATPNAVRVVWCNTGGGTNSKGHLVVLWNNTSSGVRMTCADAGAALANVSNGGGVAGNTVIPAAGGANVTTGIDVQTNGFGATSGVTATSYVSGSYLLNFGQWTVDSTGNFATNSTIGNISLGQQATTRIRILRMATNTYACVHPVNAGTVGLAVVAFNLTSVNSSYPTMTTATTASDVAATWQPYWNSATQGWDAFVDTAGKGWVYSGSSVATTLLKWGFTQSGTTPTLDASAPTKLDTSVGPSVSTNGTDTTVRGCQVVQSQTNDFQVFNTWNTLYSLLGDFGGNLPGGAEIAGPTKDPGNALAYAPITYMAEVNPATGVPFTLAQVNNLEAGIKIVT